MMALDTNVLVRYLTTDDAAQAARAKALIEGAADRGESMYVSHIVLCELVWVLTAAFGLEKDALVDVLTDIIRTAQFAIEEPDLAARALRRFEDGAADFADYVVAERAADAGCDRVATFDRKLLAEAGFVEP
jgi:predicted nucleic-acid-binding protein